MDDLNSRQEINKYRKFKKVDGATYHKVNQFLRKRTYITAREWALARLCTDFRTSGGAEMTFIGQHLPELVPFMEDTYTPQAVNQARNAFKKKVRKSSATFFYGAMCGFFTTDELDDLLFEASEVARFLLEVEGTTLDIDEEIDIEDRITKVMRGVGQAAKTLLKNRSDDEAVKDQLKKAGPSAPVSGREDLPQECPDAPRDRVVTDTRITAAVPDPTPPESAFIIMTGTATETEIPDELSPSGEDPVSSGTVKIEGPDEPMLTNGDNTGKNTESKASRTVTIGLDREDS
jgi:hypothetical protein